MARLHKRFSSSNDESGVEPRHRSQDRVNSHIDTGSSLTPSPSLSVSSDKENQASITRLSQSSTKSARIRRPSTFVTKEPSNKRRKLGEQEAPNASSQATQKRQLEANAGSIFYDPDQPMEQRREVRRQLRDLGRQLVGIRLLLSKQIPMD